MAFSLGPLRAICQILSERVVADDRATRKENFSLSQQNRICVTQTFDMQMFDWVTACIVAKLMSTFAVFANIFI